MEKMTPTHTPMSTCCPQNAKSSPKTQMGTNAKFESLGCSKPKKKLGLSKRRLRSRKLRSLKLKQKSTKCCNNNVVDEDADDKAEVERKIVALQRIVPGGEGLGVDKLFEETAGYILALQCQVKAMRTLASFFEGLEKQKRKLGG